MSAERPRAHTAICGFDADSIAIRGRDLVHDLMGKVSFTELMLLQSLGSAPTETQVGIVDAVLVTIMEHGLVPSAVATRLTYYGAPESFQGAVAAGLLGVGDRYAGTAGECGAVLERIVAAGAAEREAAALAEVRSYRAARRPVPGFGHPIHQQHDPRVPRLIEIAESHAIDGQHLDAMRVLERTLQQELKKDLVTNISAAIAAVLGEAGVPASLMRGIVLTARCAGLVGHLHEEMQSGAADAMWRGAQDAVDYEP
ncbi:MAG: citryl-CoA lyase [Gammaproteobacteria bacterium]|nr:citryl-CoA lyase [Gammaproteobacteria bacterium]NNM00241.1 citryl-CoA lyase [Gammaproteobacteria bacterium]